MSFHVTHREGRQEANVPISIFEELFLEAEDNTEDNEHTSVSVTHESEWDLGYYGGGYLIFENLEDGHERHMRAVSKSEVLRLWVLLSEGKISEVENADWLPGYGS